MKLISSALVLGVLTIFATPVEAGWWHRRWCSTQSQMGSATAFGTFTGPSTPAQGTVAQGTVAQGFVGGAGVDIVGSLITEYLRRQLVNLPVNLPIAPSGGQGVEAQLAAINATLVVTNSKLETIAEAIKRKEALGPIPSDRDFNNNTPAAPPRPISPPPLGALVPQAVDENALAGIEERLGTRLGAINNRLQTMQEEINGLKRDRAGESKEGARIAPSATNPSDTVPGKTK